MKERSISFNDQMIRAILEGRKTQTRRVLPYGQPGDRLVVSGADIRLEITNVRAERLQDISEADASAEGFPRLSKDGGRTYKYGIPDKDGLPGNDDIGWHWSKWCNNAREAFRLLWSDIYGAGAWDLNPWVWVIEFKRLEQ